MAPRISGSCEAGAGTWDAAGSVCGGSDHVWPGRSRRAVGYGLATLHAEARSARQVRAAGRAGTGLGGSASQAELRPWRTLRATGRTGRHQRPRSPPLLATVGRSSPASSRSVQHVPGIGNGLKEGTGGPPDVSVGRRDAGWRDGWQRLGDRGAGAIRRRSGCATPQGQTGGDRRTTTLGGESHRMLPNQRRTSATAVGHR